MALVDDYDVVVIGLAHLFDPYRDRIVVAELDTNQPVIDDVDVVLYDSFAQPEADHDDIAVLVANPTPATSWSTRGTSTPRSSTAPWPRVPAATSPRRSPPANS